MISKIFKNREIANEFPKEKGIKQVRFGVDVTYVCVYICVCQSCHVSVVHTY